MGERNLPCREYLSPWAVALGRGGGHTGPWASGICRAANISRLGPWPWAVGGDTLGHGRAESAVPRISLALGRGLGPWGGTHWAMGGRNLPRREYLSPWAVASGRGGGHTGPWAGGICRAANISRLGPWPRAVGGDTRGHGRAESAAPRISLALGRGLGPWGGTHGAMGGRNLP